MQDFVKICDCFQNVCPFLSLTIITGQRSFSSLADGLLDLTPETKKLDLKVFTAKSGSFSFKFAISKFLKYQFFYLFTNKARERNVA